MKRNSNNDRPFARVITHALPKQLGSARAIEINAGQMPTMDVRFLCVALRYPYMFATPASELIIERRWAPAFTQTCIDIDKELSKSTHGFCWRMLGTDSGEPFWYWSLAQEYDQQLHVTFDAGDTSVRVVNSWRDPVGELRSTIQATIDMGKRRAVNWQAGSANDAHGCNPGGVQ